MLCFFLEGEKQSSWQAARIHFLSRGQKYFSNINVKNNTFSAAFEPKN